jgi:hypothetical protein
MSLAPSERRRPRAWQLVLTVGVLLALSLAAHDALGGGRATAPMPAAFSTDPPLAGAPVPKAQPTRRALGAVSAMAPMVGAPEPTGALSIHGTVTPPRGSGTPATLATTATADGCVARAAGAISAEQAAALVDTFQAVAFQVTGTKDTGRVTFLNSHNPYQGHFYVAVFPTLYDQFPAPPVQYFRGKCVAVQGQIELYRGTPQLVVRTADDIRVLDGP